MNLKNTNRRGAMIMLIVLVMVILLVAAVFSVDVAQMHMVRAELRTATDAAARAGTEALIRTQDPDLAVTAALAVAELNQVAGNGLTLRPQDIEVGTQDEQTNGKFAFRPSNTDLSAVRVTGSRDANSLDGPAPLLFASLFGVTEFRPSQQAVAASSVRDIALVLDRSGSMGLRSGGGTRLTALQQAVRAFINEVNDSSPNSQISLITYSTNATQDEELTEELDEILDEVNDLRARGLTNIFRGLRLGSDSLERDPNQRRFADKTIIVMTDGNFNRGGTPIPSANVAANRGHTIHTITFSNGANQAIMRDIARIGGGRHIHADGAGDLSEAFREIARTLRVFLSQ